MFVIQDANCLHFKQINQELPNDDREITPEQHELFLDFIMRYPRSTVRCYDVDFFKNCLRKHCTVCLLWFCTVPSEISLIKKVMKFCAYYESIII